MGLAQITLSLTDQHIAATAAIQATKMVHQHSFKYSQPNTTATAETRTLHVAHASGTLVAFRAGSIAIAAGAATVTVDLKKNGTTVLSAVITLDSGNTARVSEDATLSVTSYAAGDWFEIVTTATAGGGTIPTGFFCEMVCRENPA